MTHIDSNTIVTDNEIFMTKVLAWFQNLYSVLRWEVSPEGRVAFRVTAAAVGLDPAPVTPETIDNLIQCLNQVQAADPGLARSWGVLLFIARYHGRHISFVPDQLKPLFDEGLAP